MKHLEYIDDYFKGTDQASQNRQFEQRLLDDPSFAEEVAFYLTTQRLLQEEARVEKIERFRKLYEQQPASTPLKVVKSPRRLWYYVAAAAVIIGLIFTINVLVPPTKQQMADRYISQQLNDLGASMSGLEDSVERIRSLYNKGRFAEALTLSEAIISYDASNQKVLEYAGVTNLRLQQYDKALAWFKQLASYKGVSNKGIFYQALTLIKRNKPGDLTQAKSLLEQVDQYDLEGREFAREWLSKW
jgi:tetratricopeptide (TPR) repeat protein